MSLLSSTNLSLYTVPAAWWLCMVPHVYGFLQYDRLISKPMPDGAVAAGSSKEWRFDPSQPRTFLSKLESNPHPNLTSEVKGRLQRAEAASLNGYENLGFFCAAVVAANISLIVVHANEGQTFRDELTYVNGLSIGYLASRILFNIQYIQGVSGPARGFSFYGSLACATALYIRAGNALRILVK